MRTNLWRARTISRKLVSDAWVDECGYVHVRVGDGVTSIELARVPVDEESIEEFAELLLEEARGSL